MTASLAGFPAEGFKGQVLRPGDAGYDDARVIWNGRHQGRPALIARCIDAEDVAIAVQFTRDEGIPVAVRSGGHAIDGYAMPDAAFVIDTRRMKKIEVDPETRRVRADAGVTLGELDAATQEHGLAVPTGTATPTGLAGLVLGGGMGYLTRRFGMTVDNLISVDVVTADGRTLTGSEDEHSDLFWGMRGAGQNLAVATSFVLQAHEVGPEVMHGLIVYPMDQAVPVLAALDAVLATAPRELCIYVVMAPAPPLPGLPSEMVGVPIMALQVIYTGDLAGYGDAIAPVLALGTLLADMVEQGTWLSAQAMLDGFGAAGRRYHAHGGYVSGLDPKLITALIERVAVAPPPTVGPSGAITFQLLGGANNEVDEDACAYSRSGAEWLWVAVGSWDSPADDPEYDTWVNETAEAFAPFSLTNGYVNLGVSRGPRHFAEQYGSEEKWARICALKAEWDPDNRLRFNRNVAEAQAALIT